MTISAGNSRLKTRKENEEIELAEGERYEFEIQVERYNTVFIKYRGIVDQERAHRRMLIIECLSEKREGVEYHLNITGFPKTYQHTEWFAYHLACFWDRVCVEQDRRTKNKAVYCPFCEKKVCDEK